MNKIKFLLIIVLTITVCNSCKLAGWPKYSLTGASISPDVKTFSVDYFPNKAPLVVPYLSSLFTDKLTDYMRTKTGLSQMTDNNGDIRFEGQIVGYEQRPIDIQKDEIAASNRLTIRIRVKYTNVIDDEEFTQEFSHYADYSTEVDFNSVEESLITEIIEKIIEAIYTKALVNW
jgi:hypothetical protein